MDAFRANLIHRSMKTSQEYKALFRQQHSSYKEPRSLKLNRELFGQLRPTGWLRPLGRREDALNQGMEFTRVSVDGMDLVEEDSPAESPDVSRLAANPPRRDPEDAAWEQISNGLRDVLHPRDRSCPWTHLVSLPPRMKRASENKERFPDGWNGLTPQQVDGIAGILAAEKGLRGEQPHSIVVGDMGLGKTIQMIAVMELNPTAPGEPVLIIAPSSLISNWIEELHKWLDPSPSILNCSNFNGWPPVETLQEHDIVIATYEKVRTAYLQMSSLWEDLQHRRSHPYPFKKQRRIEENRVHDLCFTRPDLPLYKMMWGRKIIDESHTVKDPKTPTHKGVRTVEARIICSLTGTPLALDDSDIHAQFSLLGIDSFNIFDWFKSHYMRERPKDDSSANLEAGKMLLPNVVVIQQDTIIQFSEKSLRRW